MKNHIKSYKLQLIKMAIVAIPLVTAISSCKKDFLTAAPELSLSDANDYESPARIEALVNGLYTSAKNGALYGGRYQIYNDIRAEEFINRTSNNVTGYNVYQGTTTSTDTYVNNFWTQGYLTINRVNIFLKGLDANQSVLTPALYANYSAEAKFIRALTYFGLVQIFAKPYVSDAGASRGLPLRLTAEQSSANNELRSSSVAQIYAQILQDLNDAETGLPDTYGTALLRTTRAHKNTAIALKTRVYLTMGNYAQVITEGNKIVPSVAPFTNTARTAHALQANIASVFATPFTTSESIFSFPFADTNAPGTQNQFGYYYNVGNLEFYLNQTGTGIYVDPIWPSTDARKSALTANYALSATNTVRILSKYSATSPYLDYAPMIRYSEVLLNVAEAEALASGGNLVRSRALLDAVRKRSDASYNFGTLATGTELAATILKERRIELLGEGFRYNDLARKATPLPSFGAGSAIPVADARYTFPIPLNEVNYNPAVNW
ncbi:RagB/SusD family nutrient uptake outer membrane protein [Pedobacter sp. AW1-32]|uniref:RagB/SusD family nutrient uptake outer membrane protein n=1 Tax=Pedobacter sp. AW1-32 TaxID=3383026 RepID=UPI003FEDD195